MLLSFLIAALLLVALPAVAAEPKIVGESFAARDTLAKVDEPSDDARACLAGLCYSAGEFKVACEAADKTPGDALVRFPSPIDTGDAVNDRVAMEWYFARDAANVPKQAPAVVVIHESGSNMAVGRVFARGLRAHGVHAFLLQLPGYGERRGEKKRDDAREAAELLTRMRQGIADARRARDAVAALPLVDASHIAVQGTSLGGFVAANAAALDGASSRGYDSVFITLAGGELHDLIEHGEQDAAKIRRKLAEAGVTGEKLREITSQVEPTRIAHRLPAERTWLYSGTRDKVVPLKNALALAQAAKLTDDHHVRMNADHYSGILFLPTILAHIREQLPQ
jgi:dienelactone hydrolase